MLSRARDRIRLYVRQRERERLGAGRLHLITKYILKSIASYDIIHRMLYIAPEVKGAS